MHLSSEQVRIQIEERKVDFPYQTKEDYGNPDANMKSNIPVLGIWEPIHFCGNFPRDTRHVELKKEIKKEWDR